MKASSLIIGAFFFRSLVMLVLVFMCATTSTNVRVWMYSMQHTYNSLIQTSFFFLVCSHFFHMKEEEEGKRKAMEETHTRQTIMVRAQTLCGALLVVLSFHLRRFFFCFPTLTTQ